MGNLLDLLGAVAGGYVQGRERKYQYNLAAEQEKRQRDLFVQYIEQQEENAKRQAWIEAHSTPAHFDNLANYMAGTEKLNPNLFQNTRYLGELLRNNSNLLRPRSYGLRSQQESIKPNPMPSLQSTAPISLLGNPSPKPTQDHISLPYTSRQALENPLQQQTQLVSNNPTPQPYFSGKNPYALKPLPSLANNNHFSAKRVLNLPTSKSLNNKLKKNMPKL